ncbi:MAG: hypothetical protein H7A32_01515 [Deltaproteobacteria bacterium]|nr:hypothetical protein [Deltaproteobacteria bacterium]
MTAIIQRTRKGFAYQDKFSLLKVLDFLLKKKLKSGFIDFSFGNNGQSIDLKLQFINGEHHIYEVKTGDNFINGGYKKIGEVIVANLAFIRELKEESVTAYIVQPRNGIAMRELLDDITFVQGKKRKNKLGYNKKRVLEECFENYGIRNSGYKLNEFESYLKSVILEHSHPYQNTPLLYSSTVLETVIQDYIRGIINNFNLGSTDFEMPIRYTYLELLETVRLASEKGSDIVYSLVNKFIDDCARRGVIANKNLNQNKDVLLKEQKVFFKRECQELFNVSLENANSKLDEDIKFDSIKVTGNDNE